MTTIAYKDGIIAYDSRVTENGNIVDDNYSKMRVCDGVMFFLCGNLDHVDKFVEHYMNSDKHDDLDVDAFIVQEGELLSTTFIDDHIETLQMRRDHCYSIGSGSHYALGAMDCGKSAREAIKVAMKRDAYTGGKINTYRIK